MSASTDQIAYALRVSAKETERLRHLNRRLHEAASEPIAIVGMSCRYPGGVASPADLWDLVAGGVDAISEFPTDRGWDTERIYDPEPGNPGKSYVREGGFLPEATEFDPAFFGIGPREARATDPQGRLLLEASWEAIEDAGLPPGSLRGTPTGVFAGVMYHDYGWGHRATADELGYFGTGGDGSIASGHISYTLGLEGPAVSIDTACSSSLVSIHLAVQALRKGECSLALAGGSTVLSTPSVFVFFSHQRGIARDGRCKSFADAADGVGVSEGVGVVLLERLSDARREGHRVLATIRGSAVNQDGASNGLSAPNGPSQERVIRQALASAGLEPADVDAVEAHGTGTTLGDPIEAGALLATYGQERERPLRLGSIKSNIAHPQAAAGVAGVIKMVMALREETLPKTLHVDRPASGIEWSEGQVELLTESEDWPATKRLRRAAVSSFGISGTNAHLILEEAQPDQLRAPVSREQAVETVLRAAPPLALSARSQPALAAQAGRIADLLERDPAIEPEDVAYSLATTRGSFEHRGVIAGGPRAATLEGLRALAEGDHDQRLSVGVARSEQAPVFLFSGHGSQWPGMAVDLIESSPSFARYMEACEAALAPFLSWSPRDVLRGEDESWLERPDIVQPILFSAMVSLARLWQELGVRPAAVVGHSQGEIAAAHIAGGLSLEDAARLAAVRSRIMMRLAGQGGLASVGLSAEALKARIEPWAGRIGVAAVNGPGSTILAGEQEALEGLVEQCREQGDRARLILGAVVASHSPYVEELRDEVLEALAPTAPRSNEIPFYSTVTGGALDTRELDADYWYRNLRQPVLFEPVVRELLEQGHGLLIEVSSHPVLIPAVQECVDQLADPSSVAVVGTLRRGEGGGERFALSLAEAHAAGASLDWQALFAGSEPATIALPTYPFQRQRYWLTAAAGEAEPRAIGQADPSHALLSASIEDPLGEGALLTGRLSLQTHPWLADHAAFGVVLAPGTSLVELALAAGAEVGCDALEELALEAPLILPEQGGVAVQVVVGSPEERGRRQVSIHSRPDAEAEGQWTQHATGVLAAELPSRGKPLDSWPPSEAEPLETGLLYERFELRGLTYGPAFQGVQRAWRRGDEVFAEVALPDAHARDAERFKLHPALLDAAGHAGLDLALDGGPEGELQMPFAWRGIRLHRAGASSLRVRLSPAGGGHCIDAFDESGMPVARVDSLVLRPIEQRRLRVAARGAGALHRLGWEAVGQSEDAASPARLASLGPQPLAGLEAATYADLEALCRVLEDGSPAPEAVVLDARAPAESDRGAADACRAAVAGTISILQDWLAEERLAESRLVLLTERALAVEEGEVPDLIAAPLWGLLRSGSSEHPGRFLAIDTDGEPASQRMLAAALAAGAEEPQLAIRAGHLLAPRLAPVPAAEIPAPPSIDPDSTVLVSGGTSGVGALVARHLAAEHGARHLLLLSRSGGDAAGAAELRAELETLGCAVEIRACDVGDREQLKSAIEQVPDAHPLGVVVHSAGILDDGLLGLITPEQVDRVFAPKVDAAWHLHELTQELELSQFLLFSSAAGILGGAAQATYSAANAFLDALAAHRQAQGLPGMSMAWGAWDQRSRLAGELDDTVFSQAQAQIRERLGAAPMPPEQGLGLFDAARAVGDPLMVPSPFDLAVLRSQARTGTLPAVLRGLVRVPERRAREEGSLARRLLEAPEEEREAVVLELVRAQAASVLGYASSADVDPDRPFKDLGFDSLGAVELRNRLVAVTGMRLHSTLVFDHPSVAALAGFLREQAEGAEEGRPAAVAALSASSEEPIAIVGMACRYPGGASSPQELWRLVEAGVDAVSEFPADRGWDLDRLYDPEPGKPGSFYAREGGFLLDAADFDPGFFGISPREALAIDPQERTLLEVAWEALEDGGVDPHSLRGSATGVFAGVMYQDYGPTAGLGSSTASGRVAYTLGLEGPAISVDTACSSSLVALHLASRSLAGGECSLALAGGIAIASTPAMFLLFSEQRGLSADGRCKAFAEAADGAGVSEGAGVLLLERLSDARRNGHPVLATIRGSAINQDGASNGLTAPSGPSQERVIRQALADAGLEPSEVDAVEAHGTGTALGDPIEATALLATYGQGRGAPLRLGSIKSNIGHTQAAAGVAGVIKTVMAMRAGVLPKTLHVDAPSSKIDWEAGEVELLREAQPWEASGRPRRAGISSFGASGTNAHLVLEQAVDGEAGAAEGAESEPPGESGLPRPVLLPLSAKSEQGLSAAAARLRAHLVQKPELDPLDVAYSLATRASFEQRAVAVGDDREQLLAALAAIERGEPSAAAVRGVARRGGKLAYLFSGQGSQRTGMGSDLYAAYPAFAAAFDEVCERFEPHLGVSLRELVFDHGEAAAARLEDTTFAQPALFAVEVALFRLLESLGLRPDLLAGHSIGELSAAHVAGVLGLDDAAHLVAARGRLMGELPAGGAMLAVQVSEREALEAIDGRERELAVAALNGPQSVVVSGEQGAIEELAAQWREAGRKTKRLAVSHAFHSPLIDPMLSEFERVAAGLEYGEPRIPIVSNLSGELLEPSRAADPAYWVAHARQPVRFAAGIATLREQGASCFLELGPDAVLTAMARECLDAAGDGGFAPALAPCLRAKQPERGGVALAVATAHASGAGLDWDSHFAGAAPRRVPLPTYPFQRRRYWLGSDGFGAAADPGAGGQAAAGHPLLAAAVPLASDDGALLTGRISLATHPWLGDHALGGTAVIPGAALLELALRAGREVGAEAIEELVLEAPLVLPERGSLQLQVAVAAPDQAGRREVKIHSREEREDGVAAEWSRHAGGVLIEAAPPPGEPLSSWPPPGAEPLEVEGLYDRLADRGIDYGPAFQVVRGAWQAGDELFVEAALEEEQVGDAGRFLLHPVLLDAAGQVGADLALGSDSSAPMLPFSWRGVQIPSAGATTLRLRVCADGDRASLIAFDQAGEPAIAVEEVVLRPLDPAALSAASLARLPLYRLRWEEAAPSTERSTPPRVALLGEAPGAGLTAERHTDLAELVGAIRGGEPAPEIVLAVLGSAGRDGDLAASAHATAQELLALLQDFLAEERLGASRLCLLTEGAVSTAAGESADPVGAAAWGLVRSAQSEHPGRLALIDSDRESASLPALSAALLRETLEPQLALRTGRALAPRLAPAQLRAEPEVAPLDLEKTVLITGGTGGLGALLARHLAGEHGVRHLLLASRQGEDAAGAAELRAELEELGAEVRLRVCDVSERDQVGDLLDSVPADAPLGAVFHTAGTVEDGILQSLDAGALDRVMAPKVDGGWHLHELTTGLELSHFVLFSSAASLLGPPGQANYAAANSFLDALAVHRHAGGLAATSLAWGPWAKATGISAAMSEAQIERLGRLGLSALSPDEGLALLDAAIRRAEPLLAPVRLERAGLRAQASAGTLPPTLAGMVAGRSSGPRGESLAERLATVPEGERERIALELVRGHVAAVLGHPSGADVDPDAAFAELGFDSLAAVELRNRLDAATGLRIQPTVVFDYPSASEVARYLLDMVAGKVGATEAAPDADEADEAVVALEAMLPEMSHEEMFELIDEELGAK
jgi:acyl transferase domain-containing protein/acyl carrier protein